MAAPLKLTASNVTRVLKAAGVAASSPYPGLHASSRNPERVTVDVERPLGARHPQPEEIDGWFETAATALAERGLHLERTAARVAVVTAKS